MKVRWEFTLVTRKRPAQLQHARHACKWSAENADVGQLRRQALSRVKDHGRGAPDTDHRAADAMGTQR